MNSDRQRPTGPGVHFPPPLLHVLGLGLGLLLHRAYLGGVLITNALWVLLLLPVVLGALTRFVIRREERHLGAIFGDRYGAYKRQVRRWL